MRLFRGQLKIQNMADSTSNGGQGRRQADNPAIALRTSAGTSAVVNAIVNGLSKEPSNAARAPARSIDVPDNTRGGALGQQARPANSERAEPTVRCRSH